jgi:hypothetical protein
MDAGHASLHEATRAVIGLLVPARRCFVPAIPVRSAIKRLVAGRYARTRREEDRDRFVNDPNQIGELVYGVREGHIIWSHKAQALSKPATTPRKPASLFPRSGSFPSFPSSCQLISNPASSVPAVSLVPNPCSSSIACRRKMRRERRIASNWGYRSEQRRHCSRRP